MHVTITSCANGFTICDHYSGQYYVATRVESYNIMDQTIVRVLQSILDNEQAAKLDTALDTSETKE